MFQRSSFSIKPSEINYTCSAIGVTPQDMDNKVGEMVQAATRTERYRPPKLQVFKQTGRYFTLNNSELHLCRLLEEQGEIETVRVEMIPKHKLPEGVCELLMPGRGESERGTDKGESVHCDKCLEQTDRKSNDPDPEVGEDTQSVVSISLDSDVESVDSQPDPYLCSSPESSTSASTESDLGEDMESVV